MSTRAVIAKPHGDAWIGKYHHSDGYPAGLGVSLMEHYASAHFGGDTDAMIAEIVDGEAVGWSFIIGADFGLGAGWSDFDRTDKRPQSYAARGEVVTGCEWINYDDTESWCEWCYVITVAGLIVLERVEGWTYRGLIAWGDTDAMRALESAYV